MKKYATLFLIILMNFVTNGQNKLDKSKNELNSGASKSNQQSTSSSRGNARPSSVSESESVVGNVLVDIFMYVTYGVFKYGVIGDYKTESHLENQLTPYPYCNGIIGNYVTTDSISAVKNEARFEIEDNFIYSSSQLFGNHLKAKIRPFQYFYIQSDFHQLFELDKIDRTNNRLSLFQFNLNYDRIRFEKFNLGWNIGATYIGNEVKKAGLAYGLNAEYFMGNQISFLGSAKWSRINTLPVNAYELQVKLHRKNYYFLMGLEHLKIATPTYNYIALGAGIHL